MSGLLADLYSAGDRMKRKLGGLLSDPMGTIALGSTRMAEDTNALTRLVSEAGYMPNTVNRADQSVLVSERQKALARALLADKGAEMGMAAATVWHGSPHKFDKFDSSKIGTGEGAQAYGHGLYLAESPAVAKSYQEALAPGVQRTVDGMPYDMANPFHVASSYASMYGKRGRSPQQIAEMLVADGKPEAAKVLLSGKVGKMADAPAGSLYKVDLPDNAIARMLDWDSPLSQQTGLLEQLGAKLDQTRLGNELGVYKGKLPTAALGGSASYGSKSQPATGADLYRRIAGSQWAKDNPAQASEMLRGAGVPGIRYLDGGSRTAGEGTRNFVVFPGQEDILTILERNGVPIK